MTIRKATESDLTALTRLYDEVHTAEEEGRLTIGWNRKIYPTEQTARMALQRGDMFGMEAENRIVGCAIINRAQVEMYYGAKWRYEANDDEVMVLHTLVISPETSGKGYGKAFVRFYEEYAAHERCRYLRMDTNEINKTAKKMYKGMGYEEVDVVECTFNGLRGVHLVLLEKRLP